MSKLVDPVKFEFLHYVVPSLITLTVRAAEDPHGYANTCNLFKSTDAADHMAAHLLIHLISSKYYEVLAGRFTWENIHPVASG